MNIIDFLILIFILMGGLIGFKQGFTKSLVNFIGVIAVIVLSFLLKNSISEVFMKIFPFFSFGGLIKGLTVLNIFLYEALAFAFVYSILMIIFKILLKTTSIFERFLSFTIILGIPSKFLGFIVGVIKNYIIVFFIMYFLAMPSFSELSIVKDSKLNKPILEKTPLLSGIASNSLVILDEFKDLSKKYKSSSDVNDFNLETLDLMLKYKITTTKVIKSLQRDGKIKINGIKTIINRYEEG